MNTTTQLSFDNSQDDLPDFEVTGLLKSAAILVVDDEPGMLNFLQRALEPRCALLEVAGSAEEAEALRLRYHFDVLLVDIRLPGLSGLEWMMRLRERGVRTHVIYMTAYADLEMAVGALRNGADDFIMKPFRTEQMLVSIQRTLTQGQILRENSLLRLQLNQLQGDVGLIGESEPVKAMVSEVKQLATSSSCLMIIGETGVGKSLVARTAHKMSRRQGQLVSISCNSLAETDSGQSFLLGDEGLLSRAHKGSLLLYDVDQLPAAIQIQLLRFLEHGGSEANRTSSGYAPYDVRLIVTTSADLQACVDAGHLRRDLYAYLNALPLRVPALRERGVDINLLVEVFMHRYAARYGLEPVSLLYSDWQKLNNYEWPGNVRELRNVIEQTVLLGHLPEESLQPATSQSIWSGPGYPLEYDLETVERAHIEAVLESVENNKSAAARILGVSRKTLERKQAIWREIANDN